MRDDVSMMEADEVRMEGKKFRQMSKDAERYRFLKSLGSVSFSSKRVYFSFSATGSSPGDSLDAAVDDAMKRLD